LQHYFFTNTHQPEVNAAVADFVSMKIWGEPGRFERYCTMGVFDGDNRLIAGVVYHNWQPDAAVIEISAGSDNRRWLTRPVLRAMFDMPFDLLRCQAVIARHSENRKHLRRMWTAVGGFEHVVPRLRGKYEPAEVLTVLTDDAWFASPHYAGRKIKEEID
jgi:hypothetical protein